jgi:hypothetical protein
MKKCKRAEKANKSCKAKKALKTSLVVLGFGAAAGATIVVGLDRVMKKIFVNEDWPAEEWSNDDWAEEDLDS